MYTCAFPLVLHLKQHNVYLGSVKVDQSCVGVRGDPVAHMQPNHIFKTEKKTQDHRHPLSNANTQQHYHKTQLQHV